MAALTDLPVETIFHIFRYLSVHALLAIRLTSQRLNAITHNRSVWLDVLARIASTPDVPVAGLRGRELSTLDAPEIENLVYNTMQLRRTWTSPSPVPTRILELEPSSHHPQHGKVTGLQFLPGRGNRWLLHIGFHMDPTQALIASTLNCWDLHANPPARCASIKYEPVRMAWSLLLVNSDPTHPAAFAVSMGAFVRSPESETHQFIAYGMNEANAIVGPIAEPFKMLSQFPCTSHPRVLHGSMLFFEKSSNVNDTLAVQVCDVISGRAMFMLRVPINPADPISMDDKVKPFLRIVVYKHYIVMFRTRRILMYYAPPGTNTGPEVNIDPVDIYQWQWRIDSVECSLPKTSPLAVSNMAGGSPPPITLLVRFDSYYPWPVNLLHHFVLRPNHHFNPALPTPSGSSLPPVVKTYNITTASDCNLPYILLPENISTIASPMRMFTPSDVILGPYGTGIWIDAQTDPDPTQAGDHGQRIAARMLVGGDGKSVDESKTRVLRVCESENVWSRLAMDEEEGRIAVGRMDGKITLLDYGRIEGLKASNGYDGLGDA
ncbi:hypothetical protein BXZ70DRAFT_905197 [Cristinia sonorae]|uniref:F-box domain-containing protein n=1 Tax=Cristinia sonorae TaxID=1940300 RepID=A0A8K0XSK7_9AGAR|nr:hypothetical protein BXZ70DRAFT_905197 [Cristinia sonorae]